LLVVDQGQGALEAQARPEQALDDQVVQVTGDALPVGGDEQPVPFGTDVGQLERQDGLGGERPDGLVRVGPE
jgi:hypothetical protein